MKNKTLSIRQVNIPINSDGIEKILNIYEYTKYNEVLY